MNKYNSSTKSPNDKMQGAKGYKKTTLSVFSQQLQVMSPDNLYFS